MVKQPHPPTPKFTIDPRFIVEATFKSERTGLSRKVPIMDGAGYIDVAHQMKLKYCKTIKLEHWIEGTGDALTRWCFAQVEVLVGDILATGSATANSRDKWVKSPGMEIQVAETRAMKRAIANACNVSDREISQAFGHVSKPTDGEEEEKEEESKIPEEITSPPPDTSDQFDIPGAY